MLMAKRDYYEILGIAKDSDERTIKKAYRKLARKHHPDASSESPEVAENMHIEMGELRKFIDSRCNGCTIKLSTCEKERHELTEYMNKYLKLCVTYKLQQDKCSCKHENGVDTFEDITSVKQEEGSHHQTPCSNSDSKIDEDKETKDLKQELQPPPDDYDYSWWCAWDDLI